MTKIKKYLQVFHQSFRQTTHQSYSSGVSARVLTVSLMFFLISYGESLHADVPLLSFDNDLVAHWSLDEGNGSQIVTDSLGRNHLRLNQMDVSKAWVSGRSGTALSFDGVNDNVTSAQISKNLKPPHITMAAWVRVVQGNWQWVAAQGDNYGLYLNENHQLYFYFHHANGWNGVFAQNLKFTDKQWHHVVGSYNGKVLKVYFDGVEAASLAETRPISYSTGDQFTIGSMQGGRLFAGDIDDVRVYRRALNATEINTLFKAMPALTRQSTKHLSSNPVSSSEATPATLTSPASDVPGNKQEKSLCDGKVKPHFYVSPGGNNANKGSQNSPWKTIAFAATQLKCGTLHIKPGVYKENVFFTHSGTADNYIKVLGEKGAILDGSFGYDDLANGLLTIQDASYIIVDGITVRNSLTHGIMYKGKGKSIRIRNCRTEHTRGSGIYVYGEWPFTGYHISDVIVEHNEVHWPQEGAFDGNLIWQEDITLAGGIENFDVSYNYVNAYDNVGYHGGPIGIDVKAGIRNGVVHHNKVENIPSNGIYVDAGESEAINIKVYQNIIKNVTGYGIPIAGEDGGKLQNIEIFNNLIDTSGYSGIAFYDYAPKKNPDHPYHFIKPVEPRTGLRIYNNTIYNAGASKGWGWGIMTETQFNGRIYNNVIANSKPAAMKLGHPDQSGVTHNCVHDVNPKSGDTGSNAITTDPKFVNPLKGDFRLRRTSPCIDAGLPKGAPAIDLKGKKRPNGKGIDNGAFEL